MNKIERIKMIKAMEFIMRNVNNEDILEPWLMCGVADGDIKYGDLSVNKDDEEDLDYYIEDDEFAEQMGRFLRLMSFARKDGGLYCDDIVSKED